MRRILSEVDSTHREWFVTSNIADREDIEEVLETWVQFYLEQMLNDGSIVIESLYTSTKTSLPVLYQQYPEHPRVMNLAKHYSQRHLKMQQEMMLGHLSEYALRKLRELQAKKTKVILAITSLGNLATSEVEVVTERKVLASVQHIVRPEGYVQSSASKTQSLIASLITFGVLRWPAAASNSESTQADIAANDLQWSLAHRSESVTSLLDFDTMVLNNIVAVIATLQHILESVCTVLDTKFIATADKSIVGKDKASNVHIYDYRSVLVCTEQSFMPSDEEETLNRSQRISQSTSVIYALITSFAHYLPQLKQQLELNGGMSERIGKIRIELIKFLISALPYLLLLDYQQLAFTMPGGEKSLSDGMHHYSKMFRMSSARLHSDLVIILTAEYELLPIASVLSAFSALFRDKTAAYYEHSRGLSAATHFLPQGLLFLLSRLVIASSDRSEGAEVWYRNRVLGQRIRETADSQELQMLMEDTLLTYANSSNVHTAYIPC